MSSCLKSGYGALMILSGIPVYLIFIGWKNKPAYIQKALGTSNKSTLFTRFLFRPLIFPVFVFT